MTMGCSDKNKVIESIIKKDRSVKLRSHYDVYGSEPKSKSKSKGKMYGYDDSHEYQHIYGYFSNAVSGMIDVC